MNDSGAMAAALRLLTGREYGEAELRRRLLRKGFAEPDVAAALERCRELGYVDDARFARERARALLRSGRAVGRRLLLDLKGRGIGEKEARTALEEVAGEFDEGSLLAEQLRRRFPDFSYRAADDRQRRRVVNHFLRRGYPLSLVLSFLKEER